MRNKTRYLVLTSLLVSSATVSAQSIPARVASAPDGSIRMSFPTHDGVCGDGRFIGEDTPDGFRTYTIWNQGFSISILQDVQPNCSEGPLRLVLTKSDRRVHGLRAAVGVDWRANDDAHDLGTVSATNAANWLIDIAPDLDDDDARVALLAAAMSDGAVAQRFMDLAKDKNVASDYRQGAMRWINGAAKREGMSARADRTLREIASDRRDRNDVRERAVRVLAQTSENDAFLRDLYADAGDVELQERILRRLGSSRTDENTRWIGDVATDSRSRLALRERAVRVLGDELRRPDLVRNVYARLDHQSLRERALRVVTEHEAAAAANWLQDVSADGTETVAVRERAIRLLGELGQVDYLHGVYGDLDQIALKERVMRVVHEQEEAASADWLEDIAADRGETSALRERAIRLLGELRQLEYLQRVYPNLDRQALRERVLRVVGERADDKALQWIEGVAEDTDESSGVRERAVRILAERQADSERLTSLYDRIDSPAVRSRLIRIFADRADERSVEKLRAIAEDDPSSELRRAAARRLSRMN